MAKERFDRSKPHCNLGYMSKFTQVGKEGLLAGLALKTMTKMHEAWRTTDGTLFKDHELALIHQIQLSFFATRTPNVMKKDGTMAWIPQTQKELKTTPHALLVNENFNKNKKVIELFSEERMGKGFKVYENNTIPDNTLVFMNKDAEVIQTIELVLEKGITK